MSRVGGGEGLLSARAIQVRAIRLCVCVGGGGVSVRTCMGGTIGDSHPQVLGPQVTVTRNCWDHR